MRLVNQTRDGLLRYTAAQLAHFIPDGRNDVTAHLDAALDEALNRVHKCINAVRMWRQDEFNYLHSSQYCIFLYYFSNTIWRNTGNTETCTKLFLLNKVLNGIDIFYEVEMPDIFFIGHSVGIVLAKATYSNYFVLYQNSTVGKNHGISPVIEEGVVMYPNTAIIGRCRVRPRTIIGQGVGIINADTPGNVMAFRGSDKSLVFKPLKRDIIADFFRM